MVGKEHLGVDLKSLGGLAVSRLILILALGHLVRLL